MIVVEKTPNLQKRCKQRTGQDGFMYVDRMGERRGSARRGCVGIAPRDGAEASPSRVWRDGIGEGVMGAAGTLNSQPINAATPLRVYFRVLRTVSPNGTTAVAWEYIYLPLSSESNYFVYRTRPPLVGHLAFHAEQTFDHNNIINQTIYAADESYTSL